ncbi:MAG: LTA synthase family protein [Bacillota bacterium]|nr:LTA synthase family protein [Bacillota bacterium]
MQALLTLRGRILNSLKASTLNQLKDHLFHYTFVSVLLKSILVIALVVNSNYNLDSAGGMWGLIKGLITYVCFILPFMSFSLLLKGRKRLWYLVIFNLAFSVLLLFDVWYFRGFDDFLSMHQLNQLANLDNLGDSILSMARQWDFLIVLDAVVFAVGAVFIKKPYKEAKKNTSYFFIFLIIPLLVLFLIHYELDIKGKTKQGLLKTFWTPAMNINALSPIGYHLYDVYSYFKDSKTVSLSFSQTKEISDWYTEKQENLPDNKYKGMFKGKNLIVLQIESLENFVINQSINGQEITPNINKLLGSSIYFPRIYEQVNLGTSSDADLMTNTSVFPVSKGSTFFRFPDNTYNSLPKLMQAEGYNTIAIHPDKGAYWNWMPALKSIGFKACIDEKHFKLDEQIGLGISDESYLRQVEPIIVSQKQPFYSFLVTLSSHSPFNLPDKYRTLRLDKELDKTKLGGYFQSVHYTDEQIGKLFDQLDKDHILDNSVVVLYGDHCGIHKYYNDELEDIKPSEQWWLDNNKCVPLIIYQKNYGMGEIKSVIGGQIDIMPTMAYLMGIDESQFQNTAMGRILLKTNKNFAVLANGTYIGEAKSEEQKDDALKGLRLANEMITDNYFQMYSDKQHIITKNTLSGH